MSFDPELLQMLNSCPDMPDIYGQDVEAQDCPPPKSMAGSPAKSKGHLETEILASRLYYFGNFLHQLANVAVGPDDALKKALVDDAIKNIPLIIDTISRLREVQK